LTEHEYERDPPTDFEGLLHFSKWIVDRMVEDFMTEEESDVPSVFLLLNDKGMGIMPLDELLADDTAISLTSYIILPKAIEQMEATCFALINTGYKAEGEPDAPIHKWREENPNTPIREHPDAIEEILVTAGNHDGELHMDSRRINRVSGFSPIVDGWGESIVVDWHATDSTMRGRMVDAVMGAVTGRRLVTSEMVSEVAAVLADTPATSDMVVSAMAELGFDPVEVMARIQRGTAEDTEWVSEVFRQIAENMPEEMQENIAAAVQEHMPDYGEHMFKRTIEEQEET
jgi:hypothetical protein